MLWLASLIVAYSIHGDRLDANVDGIVPREALMLRDVAHERRVAAVDVKPGAPGHTIASFDLDVLEGDGKPHVLALESAGEEIARGSIVLPAMPEPSALSYLVIIGPLMGLAMIIAAIYIGRRVLRKAMESEPRRRPFPQSPPRNNDPA